MPETVGGGDRRFEVAASADEGAVLVTQVSLEGELTTGLTEEEAGQLADALRAEARTLREPTSLEPGQLWRVEIEGEEREFKVTAVFEGTDPLEFELERADGPETVRGQRGRTSAHPEDHGGVLVGVGPP